MKKKSKHYDSKNDLLRDMRENKIKADTAVSASWSAFMLMGLTVLGEDLGFRDKRMNTFIDGMARRNEEFDTGKVTLEQLEKNLFEKSGIIIEQPKIHTL